MQNNIKQNNKIKAVMKVIQQSIDEFEQLNDELLMYSYSSQFMDPSISRNKTETNRLVNNSQHLQLKLSKQDRNGRDNFINKFHGKKESTGKNQKGRIIKIGDATFKSNFQSGNLHMVDYVAHNTYKISMQTQINSDRMSLWFFFSCSGLKGQITFIIQGFTKSRSLYNSGMKICYREADNGQAWRRGGSKISYNQAENQQQQKKSYELKFNFFFANSGKNVQFAYCFPYSLTRLLNFIYSTSQLMVQTLSKSFEGRPIPILTIGNLNSQHVILMSARVHPGQTVSSFIIQGFIKQLLGQSLYAQSLRSNFLFKIVPMLNPDGVYRGNYRFSAAGCDLNRKWKSCKSQKHPQIYYWKQYILKTNKEKKILMYIDIHGHSCQKNVFFYGCSPIINGVSDDRAKEFPYLMEEVYGTAYRFDCCSFAMQKDKEGTARISMFRQLQNFNVFTLQSTFCGANNGSNYLESDYFKIGNKLCQGIGIYFSDLFSSNQPKFKELIDKSQQLKKKKIQELSSNPQLKAMGMEDQIGSESDPDNGQNTGQYDNIIQINKKVNKIIIKTPQSKKYNEKQRERQFSSKLNKDNQTGQINRKYYSKNNSSQITKKTQKEIEITKQKKTPIIPNLDYEVKISKPRDLSLKHRTTFDSFHKNKNEPFDFQSRVDTSFNEKSNINKIGNIESIRRKLMLEGGGAQYRRVKRLAQEFSKSNNSLNKNANFIQQSFENPIVKGLVAVNNSIQLDLSANKSKTITPQFYPYSSHGKRKGSLQICLKKYARLQSNARKVYINGEEREVKCYGNKITMNLL